jgi:hypothetical protein
MRLWYLLYGGEGRGDNVVEEKRLTTSGILQCFHFDERREMKGQLLFWNGKDARGVAVSSRAKGQSEDEATRRRSSRS